jgi:hypothetical protein
LYFLGPEYVLSAAQAPTLKPVEHGNAIADARRKFGFLLEVIYQNSPKTDPFLQGIMQKTENWHFGDHRIWGSQYQSSIGISWGPGLVHLPKNVDMFPVT